MRVPAAGGPLRQAWAEVDLDAIEHNASVLAQIVAPTALCAVVKADAYGHGAVPAARAALAGGATCLAVAMVEEGIALRDKGITAPVLLLSEPPAEAMGLVVELGLTPTLYSTASVAAARAAVAAAGHATPYGVEVKVDTGMHRVGADPADVSRIIQQVVKAPELEFAGLWTHFAVADEPGDPFTEVQVGRFEAVRAELRSRGLPAPMRVHAANSAAAISSARSRYDIVRCGIALYGYLPSAALEQAFVATRAAALRPALTWKAKVTHVQRLESGERPSYGRAYALPEAADVATVPVGYADGVPKALFESGGELLVGGRRRPIAGSVTMDQLLVDCGPDSQVRPGDEVVLIGRQGEEQVTAVEWADRLGTISYEILCRIGVRLARAHVGGSPGARGEQPGFTPGRAAP